MPEGTISLMLMLIMALFATVLGAEHNDLG
jgi:hypothetical protein